MLDVKRCAEVVLSSWIVVWGAVLTFVCMLRYWMWNVVPRLLQWNCNEILDVRCTSAEFRSPCGIQQGAVIYAVIQPEFRNLCGHPAGASAVILCNNNILQKYPKFRWDIFRLSVELPVQKHTDTS